MITKSFFRELRAAVSSKKWLSADVLNFPVIHAAGLDLTGNHIRSKICLILRLVRILIFIKTCNISPIFCLDEVQMQLNTTVTDLKVPAIFFVIGGLLTTNV